MTKTASLYRMVLPGHVCPYGLKSKWQLERHGYTVEDHWLTTKEATEAFKADHSVKTTPQTFIDGRRIGGNDDLVRFFGGHVPDKGQTSYKPVLGSGLVDQSQKMTVAARAMAEKKTVGQRS